MIDAQVIDVLDSSAMIAFLRDERGAAIVQGLLFDPTHHCVAHSVNLCEVFYDYLKTSGEAEAQKVIQTLLNAGIEAREDMDTDFWQAIGRLKAHPGRISLADCFGIALAQRVGGELVTADHHEFDVLVPLGLCPIRFIR